MPEIQLKLVLNTNQSID